MTLRELERITLPELVVEVINSRCEQVYHGVFEGLVGVIWEKEILYIYPIMNNSLRIVVNEANNRNSGRF